MWIKKTETEKIEDKERLHKKNLRVAIACWVFFSIVPPLLRRRYSVDPRTHPQIWELPLRKLLKVIFGHMIISGVGVYFLFWLPKTRKKEAPVLLCPKCGMAKPFDDKLNCKCGGNFVDLGEMKWVE